MKMYSMYSSTVVQSIKLRFLLITVNSASAGPNMLVLQAALPMVYLRLHIHAALHLHLIRLHIFLLQVPHLKTRHPSMLRSHVSLFHWLAGSQYFIPLIQSPSQCGQPSKAPQPPTLGLKAHLQSLCILPCPWPCPQVALPTWPVATTVA